MSAPKTLLEMAGAQSRPAPLSSAALVIIDAQREYVDGLLPLSGITPALEQIAALLARARAAGTPVIHIVHRGMPGGAFDPGRDGFAIADAAAPEAGEPIIEKQLPNAFAGTDLAEKLADTGRSDMIVAGFMTHMCISSTVRAALDHGFRTTVVADAVTTRDLPDPRGGVVSADTVNAVSLAALSDRFACVAPLDRIPDGHDG
ncbi:MAG: cysteine hydrolase family protein [Methyloligellaceae bacterium]